jgi:hypothetical protein
MLRTPDETSALTQALSQRNRAIACAILSITISLAAVGNTFLAHSRELNLAHLQILSLQHELKVEREANRNCQQALAQSISDLIATQQALNQARAANARR